MADTTDKSNPFVDAVERKLKTLNWRMSTLAQNGEIDPSQLSRILGRTVPASADIVRKVARAFGESQLDWFITAGYIDDMGGVEESAAAAQARAVIEQMSEEDQERALAMLQALARLGSQRRKQKK